MNILLLNQFYPPDTAPTGQFLHDLACALAARGHNITALCSSRAYTGDTQYPHETVMDGVTVQRVHSSNWGRLTACGRMLDYTSFFLAAAIAAARVRPRPDFTLSLTTPPYLGLIGRHIARRSGSQHGHWLMDLYPDVLLAHNLLSRKSIAQRVLTALSRRQLRDSALTVVLGDEMLAHAAAYGTSPRALPLWGSAALHPWPDGQYPPLRASRGWPEGDLVLMYSGNMGLGHRLKEFLAAAEANQHDARLRWVFAGGGHRRAEVEAFCRHHPGARVELAEGVNPNHLREHLCSADVHLASLDPQWQGCMVPSKLQGIFAAGRPVIFVGARDNSAARWIEDSGGGWVVPPDDLPAMLRAVTEARDAHERARRGNAAATYARTHFNRDTNCARLCAWIEAAASGAPVSA